MPPVISNSIRVLAWLKCFPSHSEVSSEIVSATEARISSFAYSVVGYFESFVFRDFRSGLHPQSGCQIFHILCSEIDGHPRS